MDTESLPNFAGPHIIPFIGNIQNRSIHRDRVQTGGLQGLRGAGHGKWLPNGFKLAFWGNEVLELEQ